MIQHTYTLRTAINTAKAVLPCASRDDATPVIMSAHITPFAWYTTDRYTIAKHENVSLTDELDSIVLPLAALEWVTKINVKQLRHPHVGDNIPNYQLRITQTKNSEGTPDTVEVAIMYGETVERSQLFDAQPGNYPPVDRLINGWKSAEQQGHVAYPVKLNPVHIEKITSYVKRAEKEAPITIELGIENETSKPTPVRFTYGDLTVIIQPNLML